MVKIFWVLLLAGATAFAQFNAEAGTRSDYRFSKGDTFTQGYGLIQYQKELDSIVLNASVRGYYALEHPEYKDGWIDELTVSAETDNTSILLGKHQVNWGESDYFRVVNVINPIDFRDYYLSYVDNYKSAVKSLWMLQEEYLTDTWSTTLFILPDFKPLGLPKEYSGFSNNGIDFIRSLKSDLPDNFTLGSMSAALRITGTIGESDISAYMYYGWNPALIVTDLTEKKAFRRKMFGASFTRAVESLVFRAETAYFPNEAIQLKSYGFKREDMLKTLIASDWLKGNSTVSLQLANTYICSSYVDNSATDRSVIEGSLYTELPIENNNVTFSNLTLHNFNTAVGMDELKIKYRFTEALNLFTGINLFWGDNGLLSGYKKQNRIFINLKYYY